jgi:hypothetical protein
VIGKSCAVENFCAICERINRMLKNLVRSLNNLDEWLVLEEGSKEYFNKFKPEYHFKIESEERYNLGPKECWTDYYKRRESRAIVNMTLKYNVTNLYKFKLYKLDSLYIPIPYSEKIEGTEHYFPYFIKRDLRDGAEHRLKYPLLRLMLQQRDDYYIMNYGICDDDNTHNFQIAFFEDNNEKDDFLRSIDYKNAIIKEPKGIPEGTSHSGVSHRYNREITSALHKFRK